MFALATATGMEIKALAEAAGANTTPAQIAPPHHRQQKPNPQKEAGGDT